MNSFEPMQSCTIRQGSPVSLRHFTFIITINIYNNHGNVIIVPSLWSSKLHFREYINCIKPDNYNLQRRDSNHVCLFPKSMICECCLKHMSLSQDFRNGWHHCRPCSPKGLTKISLAHKGSIPYHLSHCPLQSFKRIKLKRLQIGRLSGRI